MPKLIEGFADKIEVPAGERDEVVFDNDTTMLSGFRHQEACRRSGKLLRQGPGQRPAHLGPCAQGLGQQQHSSDQVFDIINAVPRADCDLLFGGGERLWRGWSAAKAALDKRINEARAEARKDDMPSWTIHDPAQVGPDVHFPRTPAA